MTDAPESFWKDISTAPENVKVLLYGPNERVAVGMALKTRQENIPFGVWPKGYHSWPTHWMPLPLVPEKE